MSEDSQQIIPPSFMQLFVEPGRIKPNRTTAEIRDRYGFCEDLAFMLVDTAKTKQWQLGIDESDVLARIEAGLREGEVLASEQETRWVITRLAELLDWRT